MRTPTQALLWELWRLSRWEFLIKILGQSVFWCGLFSLLGIAYTGVVERRALAGLAMMSIVGTSILPGMWMSGFENKHSGFTFHLGFTRPIGTLRLVAVPMICIACSAGLCYMIPAALLRALFGIPFPVFSIAAVISVLCAGFMMAAWSPRRFLTRMLCFGSLAVCIGAAFFLVERQNPGLLATLFRSFDAMASVFSFPAEHYATLLLLFLACVAVTVFAVDRQRHGEPFLIRMPKLELTRFTTRRPRSEQPFATPGQAQFWFGMRRTGTHLLLASFALALIAFFGFLFLNTYGHYQGRAGIFWLAALGMSPISLLVIGAEWQIGLQRQQGAIRMSTFDAAQCMDNSGLAFSKLAVLITSVCLGWIVLAATATIWIALWGGIGPWLESGQSIIAMLAQLSALTWTCIALVAIVKFVTMGAMLITSGLMLPLRPKSSIAILTVMAGYLYAAIWDARHGWLLRPVWEIHAWLVAAVLVVGTCLLLKKAIGEGHLAKRRYVPAFGLWIAYVGAGLALWLSGMSGSLSVPLSVTVLTLGILTLPLASVAMLPLALSAHRHR